MPSSQLSTVNSISYVALVVAMSTVIMWFSARLTGLRQVNIWQSFIATAAVSALVAGCLMPASGMSVPGLISMGLIAFVGSVAIIRVVLHTKTFPAILVFIVNIMVQVLMISLVYRAIQ